MRPSRLPEFIQLSPAGLLRLALDQLIDDR
jgi:hypothetical protein